jgi:hypothetical protein
MVPYKEFLELWKLKYGPKTEPGKPPVPFVVERATYEGRVQEGVASFKATLEIEVLDAGWQRVPLAFSKVAFEEVNVDGAAGVLSPSGGLRAPHKGVGRRKVRRGSSSGSPAEGVRDLRVRPPPAVPSTNSFRVPGRARKSAQAARRADTTTEGDETASSRSSGRSRASSSRGAGAERSRRAALFSRPTSWR